MDNLSTLHEAAILDNIQHRFRMDLIYTNTGPILIAMNPFKWLPIYGDDVIGRYHGRPYGALPPHCYQEAEDAFTSLQRTRKNQAIEASPDGLWERAWLASDGAPGAVASVDRPYLSVSQLTQECLEAAGSSLVPKKRPPPPPRPAPKLSERPPPRHNAYAAAVTASSSPFRQAKHRAKHAAPPPPPAPDVVRHQLNVGAIYGAFEDRLIQNDDALKRILAKSEKLVRPSP